MCIYIYVYLYDTFVHTRTYIILYNNIYIHTRVSVCRCMEHSNPYSYDGKLYTTCINMQYTAVYQRYNGIMCVTQRWPLVCM